MLLIAAAAHGQELCGSKVENTTGDTIDYALGFFIPEAGVAIVPHVYEADTEPKTLFILAGNMPPLSESEEDSLFVSAAFRDSLLRKKVIFRFKTKSVQSWVRPRFRPLPPKRKP
jgi:hypothetical protein